MHLLRRGCTSFGGFVDGTSSTLLLGEVIIGQNVAIVDHRGDLYNDDRGCSMFMTYIPPNSPTPDHLGDPGYCCQGYGNNPGRRILRSPSRRSAT